MDVGNWKSRVGNIPAIAVLTSDQTETSTTPQTVTELAFDVESGDYYEFSLTLAFRSSSLADGPKVSLTCPSASLFAARVSMHDGTMDNVDTIRASGGTVSIPAVAATATDYVCRIEGVLVPTASGTLQFKFGSATGTGTITLKKGSAAVLHEIA